jgi:hypothetical protein
MNQMQEEFYQVMTRLRANSRAASVQEPKDDARVTEIVNGLIVSKPANKVTDISNPVQERRESEAEVIDLQEYAKSKAGSVSSSGINKLKAIYDFITSNGRV